MSETEPINLKDDKIRILCQHYGDVYQLHMGQGMVRQFTDETLPDEIKSLLAMINTFDWREMHEINRGPLSQWMRNNDDYGQILWAAKPYYPPISADIGWRINDRYALVLQYDYFKKLRGQEES